MQDESEREEEEEEIAVMFDSVCLIFEALDFERNVFFPEEWTEMKSAAMITFDLSAYLWLCGNRRGGTRTHTVDIPAEQ